ncbi:unnamed protein product [Clonostachys byssicola]|uniref:Uncharacterized protein n=1 Tax=Clonostachys byssicola TaxID=160290 RepID=A0A9N9UVR4_9HYPO|nr:unnamed protein product [Clonostachys byssicola]
MSRMVQQPQQPVENSTPTMRVLLQTIANLVLGDVYVRFVDIFKRDFDHAQERLFPFHDNFGLNNLKCFSLLNHHGHDHTIQEDDPPVFVWMKWTGQSLYPVSHLAFISVRACKWPFTWEGRKFHRIPQPPRGSDGKLDPIFHREDIQASLRLGIPPSEENIVFLREHPEHAKWLKIHLHHDL